MKKLRIGFIGVFIVILFVFLVNTITNNQEVSDVEKRSLATFPKFNLNNLKSESYYDDLTIAFSDQLFGRGHLVKGYYLMQFQRYLGDVVEGKDGEMFSSVQTPYDIDLYSEEMLNAIVEINKVDEELEKNGTKFIFLSIPRKDAYLEEYLPNTYTSSRERYVYGVNLLKDNLNSDIILIDALEVFDNNKGDNHYYFKTDHHINVRGGQLLYEEIMNVVKEDYDVNIYSLDDLY